MTPREFWPRPNAWMLCPIICCLLVSEPRSALARQNDGAGNDAAVALAEQKAAQAFGAYQDKRYAEAVTLYVEAYDAAPNADILYNIARIYDTKLGDRPLAINFYRRYIADPGAVADRIQISNERLSQLREAEFAATRPMEPAKPAPTELGTAPTATSASADPVADPEWSEGEVVGVIIGASGILAIAVGAGFGVAAMSETATAKELCDGNLCREQRGIDAARSASDHATVSTIGFASGGALLAVGAAVYFWLGDTPMEATEQASNGTVNLAAGISQNPGGWSLELGGSW